MLTTQASEDSASHVRHRLQSRWLIPLAVAALSTTMTLSVWLHLQRAEITQQNAALTREIALISVEVRDRLHANALALRGIRAFFGTRTDQSPEQWQTYTQQLDMERHTPWLRTYGFARRINGADPALATPATANIRKLAVLPTTPPAALHESFVIEHIAPIKHSNKIGVGFDLYSDGKFRQAIALARDHDNLILAGPGIDNLGERSQTTLTMMLPVYTASHEMRRVSERRRDIKGVTFATFRMSAFMDSLNSVHDSALGLRIFDDLSFNNEHGEQGLTLLFDSFGESTGTAGLIEEREIEFGQRKWLLQFQPRGKLPLLRESSILLGGGLIISFLLGLLTWNQSIRRQQAEGYAEKVDAELRRSEERFQLALQATHDGIWDGDFSKNEIHISTRMKELLGYTSDNMTERVDFVFSRIHPDDFPMMRDALVQHLKNHETFDIECRMRKADNQWRWFRACGQAVWNDEGRATRIAGAITDIGQRKEAEAELLRHRDHLQEMVAEQTADLLRAKDIAERANHTKSEFLANMSHELRTPMHAVLSFAALGEEKAAAGNTEKLGRYFQRIRQSGERLLMLLNNLLDLSKLEAGKMHVELARHDLLPFIEEAGAELEMLFTRRHLKLLIEPPPCNTEAICDPARFSQVIHNLLSNAIKFSPDEGCISVKFERSSMSAGRRTDDGTVLPTLRITISDQGVGIPADELDTIFDKFVQSSKTKNGAGGTGLGLSICREIMNAHRGTIEACNNPQRGASFILQLPITPSPFIHSAPREA
jgi:PAS domain S-box-containing protein